MIFFASAISRICVLPVFQHVAPAESMGEAAGTLLGQQVVYRDIGKWIGDRTPRNEKANNFGIRPLGKYFGLYSLKMRACRKNVVDNTDSWMCLRKLVCDYSVIGLQLVWRLPVPTFKRIGRVYLLNNLPDI